MEGVINLFELARRHPGVFGIEHEGDANAIASARDIVQRLFWCRLVFSVADVPFVELEGLFDIVLLRDGLDHLPRPPALPRRTANPLWDGRKLSISVPTPRYPRVFGRRFHEPIGHLADGYTLEGLNALVPLEFRVCHCQYTTGLVASALCAVYYRR